VYEALRAEAASLRRPATAVAREAIEAWLRERKRAGVREAIATYALKHAGTAADLDASLESASLELLRGRAATGEAGRSYWRSCRHARGRAVRTAAVIVVSHDGFNEVPTWRPVISSPSSDVGRTQARRGPTAVLRRAGVGALRAPSVALCHQVTTLDRAKLSQRLGTLPHAVLLELQDGLRAGSISSDQTRIITAGRPARLWSRPAISSH